MGAEISSLVIEPLLGIGIIALAILAIMRENQNETSTAKWAAIGAVALAITLIILNIVLTFLV
jgi:hypothetical protein